MLAIKVYEDDKPIGYISEGNWSVTKYQDEAMTLNDEEIIEAKRIAERFEDTHDCIDAYLHCKVVSFQIIETEIE